MGKGVKIFLYLILPLIIIILVGISLWTNRMLARFQGTEVSKKTVKEKPKVLERKKESRKTSSLEEEMEPPPLRIKHPQGYFIE